MFLGVYDIDEYVAIPAATHRFSSGAAYQPTALTYSIYEEGGTTGLDENVDMTPASPFDAIVGAYLSRRQLTAAAGFERGKTYVAIVKATVDSVAAVEMHVFQIRAAQSGDAYARIGAPEGASVSADIAAVKVDTAAIKAKTDNLPASPAQEATLTTIAGYLDTEIAAILADTNEIQTDLVNGGRLDLLIDAIKAKTDNLPTDPADQSTVEAAITAATSPLATAAALDAVDNFLDTEIAAILAAVDTEVAAIKAKTDNLPASPANEATLTTIAGYLDTEIAAILVDTNELQTDLTNGGRLDLLIDAIKAKTDNLPTDPADQSAVEAAITAATSPLATAAALDAVDNYVDTEVAAIKAVTDKIDTALEVDGAVYRLTTNALEQAPSGGSSLTVQDIVDGVLDEMLSSHTDVGSVGAGIAAAGSSGDPWSTPLPGAYGDGTAGDIIGNMSPGDAIVLPVMQGLVYNATATQSREVTVVQGDTPRITFDLDADYTGWTPYFGAKAALADTSYAIDPKACVWSDVTEGEGYVDLTAVDTATRGKYFAEIELRNGDQRLTAMKFYLKVIDAVIVE